MLQTTPKRTTWEPAALVALGVSVALLLASAWHHDFWGDEAHTWLLVRDSATIRVLMYNIRFEGHPPFWHLILWGITRFSANPEWMKVPTVLFSVATVVLVMRAPQLPLWVRLGVVFSYFIAFEYSVINRNYMPGIMLLLAAVACRHWRYRNVAVPVLLALAAQTSLPALIVATSLYGWYLNEEWRTPARPRFGWEHWAGMVLVLGSIALALWVIHPPADSAVEVRSLNWERLLGSSTFFTDAFVPVPRWTVPFWNRAALTAPVVRGFLGMGLLGLLIVFFREWRVRCFLLAVYLVLMVEMIVAARAYQRHVGWLFVAFLLALMMEEREWTAEVGWRKPLLASLLAAQVIGAGVAFERSWQYPFSANRQAAQFLLRENLNNVPLVMPEAVGTPVLAYLDRTAYYPGRGGGHSFVMWDKGWRPPANANITRDDLEAAGAGGPAPVVVVGEPLSEAQRNALHVKVLEEFDEPTCQGEILFLYR